MTRMTPEEREEIKAAANKWNNYPGAQTELRLLAELEVAEANVIRLSGMITQDAEKELWHKQDFVNLEKQNTDLHKSLLESQMRESHFRRILDDIIKNSKKTNDTGGYYFPNSFRAELDQMLNTPPPPDVAEIISKLVEISKKVIDRAREDNCNSVEGCEHHVFETTVCPRHEFVWALRDLLNKTAEARARLLGGGS